MSNEVTAQNECLKALAVSAVNQGKAQVHCSPQWVIDLCEAYAALEAECERLLQDYKEAAADSMALAAELAALKAVGPIGHVAHGSHTGVVFYGHMPLLPDGAKLYASPVPSAPDWRQHSVQFARGEKCPPTLETAQAAWARDQELIEEQRAEIARHKQTINQLRQRIARNSGVSDGQ